MVRLFRWMNEENACVITYNALTFTVRFPQKEQTITSMSAIDIGELQTKSYDYHTNEVINGSRWPNGAFKKIKISLPILTTQQSK